MGKSTIIGFVSVVFVAGAVSGFFFGLRVNEKRLEKEPEEMASEVDAGKPPKSREDSIMDWMAGFLEINEVQDREIRPLLRLAIKEFDELELEHESRYWAFIENSDRRIAKHLTEAQAKKLVEHNRKRRERREATSAREAEERAKAGG